MRWGVVLVVLLANSAAHADGQIRIVGSSTVFPFAAAVAEHFGRTSGFPTPVVESTGTGGGLKLLCAGGPDIANASRRIKAAEVAACAAHGIAPVQHQIGFDGIVLAHARQAPAVELTLPQLFLALARRVPVDGRLVANPHHRWRDINAALPDARIEVLGPPPTSGTRDAFVEIAMEGGCAAVPGAAALGLHGKACHALREDGRYIEAGENDNIIVQKLRVNPAALGIIGFGFLDRNADVIQGAAVAGVLPTWESIAAGNYPLARSLYFYVNPLHLGVTPGLDAFVAAFVAAVAIGEDGYLADKGLIPR